jgi:hypothetical protein
MFSLLIERIGGCDVLGNIRLEVFEATVVGAITVEASQVDVMLVPRGTEPRGLERDHLMTLFVEDRWYRSPTWTRPTWEEVILPTDYYDWRW